MQKYFTNFFATWLVLTLVYLVLFSVGSDRVAAAVGLFVPFGFLNTVLGAASLANGNFFVLVPLAVLIALFFYSGKVTARLGVTSTWAKVAFNVAALFVLTLLTDFSIYGAWMSWALLVGGDAAFNFGA